MPCKLKVDLDAHRHDRFCSRWLVENDIRQQGARRKHNHADPGVEGPRPMAASTTR